MMAALEEAIAALPGRRPRGRPRASAARRPGGVSAPPGGRHGRALPGGEPGPDGDAPAPPAPALLRPGRPGGDHPARADHRPDGPPVPRAAGGPPAGRLSASLARADPPPDARRAALPGAAPPDGHGRGGPHRRRGGGAPPGLRLPALAGAHADDRGEAPRRASRGTGSPVPRPRRSCARSPRSRSTASPRVHAASFALLAYASAYLKVHHPAEFYAALLNNQPMGFYHPATVVRDALRRGQAVRPVDVGVSAWRATVEAGAVRLGLGQVKGLREAAAARLVAARQARAFTSVDDLAARAGLSRDELTALAEVGALGSLGLRRRAALWQAERAARPPGPLFAGHARGARALAAPRDDGGRAAGRRLPRDRRHRRAAPHGAPPPRLRAARRDAGRRPGRARERPSASGSPARWSCASGRARRRGSCSSRSRTRRGSPTPSWRPGSSSGRAPRSSTSRSFWWKASSSTRTASSPCGRRRSGPRGRRCSALSRLPLTRNVRGRARPGRAAERFCHGRLGGRESPVAGAQSRRPRRDPPRASDEATAGGS